MGGLLFIIALTYFIWGPTLIVGIAILTVNYSQRSTKIAILLIPSSSLITAIIAAPATVGTEGFAVPGPFWVQQAFGKKPEFWLGSFLNSWLIFLGLTLLIYGFIALYGKLLKVLKKKT
ncbi:MAG: hypothetical protein KKC46_09885 [Proteobacteria bacterium]|nr:hypothetical protein [Pseudomonadota bacterium]